MAELIGMSINGYRLWENVHPTVTRVDVPGSGKDDVSEDASLSSDHAVVGGTDVASDASGANLSNCCERTYKTAI